MSRAKWRYWANAFRQRIHALYLASRHPGVPASSKAVIVLVVGYALSPIDLIPDFIPVLGLLDDLVLLPLGIWLAIRLIPPAIWEACQARALERQEELPSSRGAFIVIVFLWLLLSVLCLMWAAAWFSAATP